MKRLLLITWLGIVLVASVSAAHAQVGKSVTIADANTICRGRTGKTSGHDRDDSQEPRCQTPVPVGHRARPGAHRRRPDPRADQHALRPHLRSYQSEHGVEGGDPPHSRRRPTDAARVQGPDPTPHSPCFIARSTSTSTMPSWRGWSSTCSCRSTSIQRATPTSSLSRDWGIACCGSSRSIALRRHRAIPPRDRQVRGEEEVARLERYVTIGKK